MRCRRCNQPLRNDRSRAKGYGPTCWRKMPAWQQLEALGQQRLPFTDRKEPEGKP